MRIVKLTKETTKNILENMLKRSPSQYGEYESRVQAIIQNIKENGDEALFSYTKQFDKADINASNVKVTDEEFEEAYKAVDPALLDVIRKALVNIESYHELQKQNSWFKSTPQGTMLGQKVTPLEKVGVYVPGGKAVYPSSVLMNIMPAKVAGVDKIIMTTPCNAEGKVNPAVLVAAKEAGADGILLMPPHMWLRFGMNPDAPFEYVKDVAEGADIDIIIHLYPATSKAFYPVETLIKMCKEIDHVKCIKMGTRVTSIYEHDVRLLRQECPDISLITCHDETLCVSWFPGMDGALIGFAGCVPEIICPAREVFANPDKHTLKEAQDWSDRIYHISQAIYGGGQPSGEAHARLKEALYQRGIFSNALMRKPVLPLNQEEKDWVSLGLERSQLPKVDMEQYK